MDPMEESRQAILAQRASGQGVNQYQTLPPAKPTTAPQPASTSDWRSRARPVQQQPTQGSDWRSRARLVEAGGFTDRLKENYARREQEIQGIRQAGASGQQTKPETLYQGTMATASQLFVDPVAEAISTVTPEFVKEGIGAAVNFVGQLPDGTGKTLSEGIPESIDLFSKQYPRAARNIKAAGQAANLVGTTTGLAAGTKLLRNTVNASSDAALTKSMVPKPQKPKLLGTEELDKMAGQNYDTAGYLGAKFDAKQVGDKLDSSIKQALPKPLPSGKYTAEQNQLINALDEFSGNSGKNMTLEDIENIDRNLSAKINSPAFVNPETGSVTANGLELQKIQRKLRQIVDEVDTAGNDALVNGRNIWAAKMRVKELEEVALRASLSKNPEAAYQNGYKKLYMDIENGNLKGWPSEAKELLKKAATPGMTAELLGPLTSRLTAIVLGSTGNIPAAAGAQVAGMAARSANAAAIAKRGVKVQEALGKDLMSKLRDVDIPKPEYPEQLRLAAPDKIALPPMTDTQIKQAQRKLNLQRTLPSEGVIDKTAPLKLAAPDKMSALPMTEQQTNIAQRLMNKQPAEGADLSGAATKTPPSQVMKLENSLVGIKAQEFNNLRKKLVDGEISQNKFIERAKTFGLTNAQARDLAKEIKNYGGRETQPRPKPR
jgi:hypothetical protein